MPMTQHAIKTTVWTTVSGLLAMLFVLAFLTSGAVAKTYNAEPATLASTLSKARAGDVILLAPGSYGALGLNRKFGTDAERVTLKSANPNDPAQFKSLSIYEAEGLTLENLVFDYTYQTGDHKKRAKISNINKSQNITLRQIVFDGDVAQGTGSTADGFGASMGLTLRKTRNVVIEHGRFHQWYRGLVVSESDRITLRGNEFVAMRSDGVDFAAVANVLIEANYFHDFQRHPDSGDHPDMIQFWTSGTSSPSRNIVIRNNLLNAANGAWTQSIFMRNELVDSKGAGEEMFYDNITITGNVIINAHLHGITVGETKGLSITNNTLVRNHFALFADGKPGLHTPTIRISKRAQKVEIKRNIVPGIEGFEKQPSWDIAQNLQIHTGDRSAPNHYDNVFVSALQGDPGSLASFIYLPDGAARTGHFGAPMLRLSAWGDRPIILTRATQDPRYINRFQFDASLTPGVKDLNIKWTFEDGKTAQGTQVEHIFPGPGQYIVIAAAEGAHAQRVKVTIATPQVLNFDGETLKVYNKGRLSPLESAPLERTSDGRKALVLGQGREPVQLSRSNISRFFGAGSLKLDLHLRAAKTRTPAGEILRIHNNMILSMTPTGQISLWFNTSETPKPVRISTGPLRLHNGAEHHVGVRYDAHAARLSILVNGAERAYGRVQGTLRPMESWGLSFGNPFGEKTFDGTLTQLDLQVDTSNFLPN
jgi:hypothetical protein